MNRKMDYWEFRSVIRGELERMFPGWKVLQQSVLGVNGSNEERLILVMGNGSVLPTMTVRNLYESYLADSMVTALESFETVVLYSLCMPKAEDVNSSAVSYPLAKPRLLFALYHYESNAGYFADTVYYRWLDLMLVLRLEFSGGMYTSFVKKSRQEAWGISDEVLYQDAMRNMTAAGFEFTGLNAKLQDLSEGKDGVQDGKEEGIYVLSNKGNMFGAAVVAVPGFMAQIAKSLGAETLILLPCSVHMVLVCPVNGGQELRKVDDLRKILQEMNESEVQRELWLSNNVYVYYADVNRVFIL